MHPEGLLPEQGDIHAEETVGTKRNETDVQNQVP